MFYIGLILIILGAVGVYGTNKLSIKGGGFLIAVVGVILLLNSEFPSELQFLRLIRF